MSNEQRLIELINKGFYVDNLYEMSALCRKLALDTAFPVEFFVLRQVFLNIARGWEDRAVTVDEAQTLESKLKEPARRLVECVIEGRPNSEINTCLRELVSIYLAVIP